MKTLLNVCWFLGYGLCSGIGLILLKMVVSEHKMQVTDLNHIVVDIRFLIGFILYASGFSLWLYILSKFKMNVAFPIAMAIFFSISSLGSYLILSEPFTIKHIIGILLCFVGILFIGLS